MTGIQQRISVPVSLRRNAVTFFSKLAEIRQTNLKKDFIQTPKKDLVYLKGRGADATGILTNEGIIVCKGSQIRESPVPSCPDWIKELRTKNEEHIKGFVLSGDIAFSSPSQAAAFCMFGTANGRKEWKYKSGKTLKEHDAEV